MSWEYRSLGRTGVKVSPLCLGCMMFGKKTDTKDSAYITDRALDAGINFFDTANVYRRGKSEEYLGKALKKNGKREQIVMATKVHGPMSDDDPNLRGNSRRHIIQQCDTSLKRLQTDWIDLYQIHRPMSDIPIDETLRALDDLVRAGKIRYIGTSTYAAWQLLESLWVSKEFGLNRFVTEQPPYNLVDRRIERELLPMLRSYGFGILPWSPLAGGFLTGKYKRDTKKPEDARFDEEDTFPSSAFDVLESAEKIASEKQCTTGQLALAWCMNQPGITSPIIGPRTMEQLEDNIDALDLEITDLECEQLDAVSTPGDAAWPRFYNADFGPHQYRW